MKQRVLWMLLTLILCCNCVIAQKRELKTEEDGFKWYKITDENGHVGVESVDGNTLIPLSRGYDFIVYHNNQKDPEGYFCVQIDNGEKQGACDIRGKEIVSPKYSFISRHGGGGDPYYFGTKSEDWKSGVCDMSGIEIFPPIYESIIYLDNNFKIQIDGNFQNTGISLNSDGIASGIYNASSYSSTTSNNSISSSYTSSTPTVKELFDEAFDTPDSEAQLKYDRYMKVIQADPYNSYGYKALAYNNLGVLYENLGDLKNAKVCYEYALQANPNYEKAKQNLKSVKKDIRAEKWSNIGNALGALGEALGGGQAGGSYNNSYQETNGTYNSMSGSNSGGTSSTTSKNCKSCAGSGKCSGSHRCRGTGKCNYCNGEKITTTAGHYHECGACHGSGKCSFCNGTGRCKNCGGTGKG